jgi:hypothetical protein
MVVVVFASVLAAGIVTAENITNILENDTEDASCTGVSCPATVRIRAFDAETHQPVRAVTVVLNSRGIVTGKLRSDGQDSLKLRAGKYHFITLAKGYKIHHQTKTLKPGRIYNMVALMRDHYSCRFEDHMPLWKIEKPEPAKQKDFDFTL